MPRLPNEFIFDDRDALAITLAESVADNLRAALATQGRASLVVSGGRTPIPFFTALSKKILDWRLVAVTLADERWVDTTDTDSNEALARKYLLQNQAAPARWVGLKNSAAMPQQGEAECEIAIASVPHPFDNVILGMGEDGHIASLFPHSLQLASALDKHSGKQCIGITPLTAPHARMSLTLPALLASRRIVIIFTGAEKYEVYRRALQAGPAEELPVRSILHQSQVPVDVYRSR